MSRMRWQGALMGLAILGITGFQVYWLKENYSREKRTLRIRSGVAFRESVMELQVAKLNLDNIRVDSTTGANGKLRVFVKNHDEEVSFRPRPDKKIVSTINVIRDKLRDSIDAKGLPQNILISVNQKSNGGRVDTLRIRKQGFTEQQLSRSSGRGDRIFSLLYGVDSLQDSIRIEEIDSSFRIKLAEEKINIPYTIRRTEESEDPEIVEAEVTLGFANPVTYRMETGNSFSYLVRRISLPILFSILLLGITVLSFVMLYRNLIRQHRLAVLKNEFISNITHELKTPIATVGVAIEALKNFNAIEDPRRTREYLDISSNELQRLGFLVDKVLKLSMFEKKEMDLKYEEVSLKEVVDEVVESLRLQLEKYKAEVTVVSNGDVVLKGDRLHLLSVVFNLLDNALKYSRENPAIDIRLEGKDESVELFVKDNGIGIEPVYQEKIFEKFFRVPQGNVHNAKGYGLGLSYVAEVIKKHKGSIHVESKLGEGTEFTIRVPKEISE